MALVAGIDEVSGLVRDVKATPGGALCVQAPVSISAVGSDWEPAFADLAAANTAVSNKWDQPAGTAAARQLYEYAVQVVNPSNRTDLTVQVYTIEEAFGPTGENVDVLLDEFTVDAATILTVEDCEDDGAGAAWSAGAISVTASAEASIIKEGAASAKFECTLNPKETNIGYETLASGITTLSAYDGLRLWIRCVNGFAADHFAIMLDDANTPDYTHCLESWNLPALTANTYRRVYLPFADPSIYEGVTVASIGLYNIDSAGLTTIFYIDDVQAIKFGSISQSVPRLFSGGGGCRIRVSNDTILNAGGDDSFTAHVRIKEVG